MKYLDICIQMLQSIVDGITDANYYIDDMKKRAKEVLDDSQKIVLCGAMPYAKLFVEEISKTKECYFFDNCESEGLYLKCPIVSVTDLKYKFDQNTIFIILSRSGLEFYNYVINALPFKPIVLYYAQIVHLFNSLFTVGRMDYTVSGLEKELNYIIEHAAELQELLNELADEQSKEVMARIILFRLTSNLKINDGVKTIYDDYLEEDIIHFGKQEIVADLGGYIGDTLYEFASYFAKNNIAYEYHLFEPSKRNYATAIELFDADNVHFYNLCIGNENKLVSLGCESGSVTTIDIDDSGVDKIEMVKLDDILTDVTYIKMDIEGSEQIALEGMRDLIEKCHPKLAVCIYHKYDDILKLVNYVKSLTEGGMYKYYIRAQRDSVVTEMVLYAIPG